MSKLFSNFAGQHVKVIMRSIKGSQQVEGGVIEGNVILEGVLLDEDADFYYLGTDQTAIDEALRKSDVVRIYLETEEEEHPLFFDLDDSGDRH